MPLHRSVEEHRQEALDILNKKYRLYFAFSIFIVLFAICGPAFIIFDNMRRDVNQWSDLLFFLIPLLYVIPLAIQFPKLTLVRNQVKSANNIFIVQAQFRLPKAGLKRYFIFNDSNIGFVSSLANPSRWNTKETDSDLQCVVFADSGFTSFDSPVPGTWESMPVYDFNKGLIYKMSNETKDFRNYS